MRCYSYEKEQIKAQISRFDRLIKNKKEHRIISQINSDNKRAEIKSNPEVDSDIEEIDRVFFVWLGAINNIIVEYMDVWISSNNTFKSFNLYYDSGFMLFGKLKEVMNHIYTDNHDCNLDTIKNQNDFFRKIRVLMRNGKTFDQSIILLSSNINATYSSSLSQYRADSLNRLSTLKNKVNIIDIAMRKDLFIKRIYHDMYHLELILRGNAAAASDIVRMLILYLDGGMYVDVDTLPSLDQIFGDSPKDCNLNVVNIVRSEYYIRALRASEDCHDRIQSDITAFESLLSPVIIDEIKDKLSNVKSLSLDIAKPIVYINSISMASFCNMYEFNNNILVASKLSRIVKVILTEMARRYKHLFRRAYHLTATQDLQDNSSLSRLSNYRYDGLLALDNNVTLFLTGPSLILEVMLGVCYDVLGIDKKTSPLAISYALNSRYCRFSYCSHTNYTPEHVRSSWF